MRVIPRARRSELAGIRGEVVFVRLAAPPVDGVANDALIRFLAGVLGCRRADVAIVSGHTSRAKRIAIAGTTAPQLAEKLSAILRA